MPKTARAKKIIFIASLYGILLLVLTLTNPEKLPLRLLFLPFILIFFCLFFTLKAILYLIHRREGRSRKDAFIAGGLAGIPTLALILSSINQLTVRDVALLGGLLIAGLFYISRLNLRNERMRSS